MPTYEYECRACAYTFERVQNMSDDPVKVCPKCGEAVRRIIFGGSGVIFKGSGFYVNDSRGKNAAAPAGQKQNSGDSGGSHDSSGTHDTSSKQDASGKMESSGKKDSASKQDASSSSGASSQTSSSSGASTAPGKSSTSTAKEKT